MNQPLIFFPFLQTFILQSILQGGFLGGFRQIALQAFGGFDAQRAQFFGSADQIAGRS